MSRSQSAAIACFLSLAGCKCWEDDFVYLTNKTYVTYIDPEPIQGQWKVGSYVLVTTVGRERVEYDFKIPEESWDVYHPFFYLEWSDGDDGSRRLGVGMEDLYTEDGQLIEVSVFRDSTSIVNELVDPVPQRTMVHECAPPGWQVELEVLLPGSRSSE